ncbi:hypothetical protein NSQ96_13520 [Caldifermentibacillus hisashii]|uniref:hypothetical protein n=1 Tax=Caldifermentibacillus hisashii TaxID=996558 RepID=UPI0031FCC007
MATSLNLVATLRRKMLIFDDEPESRRCFEVKKSYFWRRDLFSSSYLGEKFYFLATRTNLSSVTLMRPPLSQLRNFCFLSNCK